MGKTKTRTSAIRLNDS